MTTFKDHLAVVHCPKSHDELQVEDAESGEILAIRKTKEMEFHSRLAMSSNERYLLSAGWFWHPLHGLWASDLVDGAEGYSYSFGAEVDSAAFLGDDRIVVTTTDEMVDDQIPRDGLAPMQLGVWSIAQSRWLSTVALSEFSGMIMPWRDWIISFYGHPKAIEASTGQIVQKWNDINSGRQVGAINLGTPPPPPIALDPKGGRFAVGGPEGITVISLSA